MNSTLGWSKGRPYHEEILNSGRLPRDRGLKAWKGRVTFEKEYPMITCIHQRRIGGGMTYFDVRTKQSLLVIFVDLYIVIAKYTQTNIWVIGS